VKVQVTLGALKHTFTSNVHATITMYN